MLKYYILTFFCCASCMVYSQQPIVLEGKIVADSLNETAIHIYNATAGIGTINSPSGDFKIKASLQDTLIFTSIQYENQTVIITPEIFEKSFLLVQLKEEVNMLGEVQLSNIRLSGNLKEDLNSFPIFNQAAVGFPYQKKVMSNTEKSIYSYKSSAMGHLFNFFSDRDEKLEEIIEIEKEKDLFQTALAAVSVSFFTEQLKIPQEQIKNFINYCMDNPNFYLLLTPKKGLELIEYYQMKAPKFLKWRSE